MKLVSRRQRRNTDEAMLPLINLVFLLMVLFMLVGGITEPDALDLQAAQARQLNQVDDDGQGLLVSREGQLALGGTVFDIEQLELRIEAWRQVNPERGFQIKADARADAQFVVALLEQLRDLGLEQVELLTVQAGE